MSKSIWTQYNEIKGYSDNELKERVKLYDIITSQDLKKQDRFLKATLVGYIVMLTVILLNAFFWHSVIVSVASLVYILLTFVAVEFLDRKTSRSMRHYTNLVHEAHVRAAYALGLEEGKLAGKKVVKKAVKKAVKQVKDDGRK